MKRALVFSLMMLFLLGPHARAQGIVKSLPDLQKELADVRSRIESQQQRVFEQSKALWQKQHDLEYEDPEIMVIREKMVKLEGELVKLRAELQARLKATDAYIEVNRERKALFQELQELRNTEQGILNEIATATAQGQAEE